MNHDFLSIIFFKLYFIETYFDMLILISTKTLVKIFKIQNFFNKQIAAFFILTLFKTLNCRNNISLHNGEHLCIMHIKGSYAYSNSVFSTLWIMDFWEQHLPVDPTALYLCYVFCKFVVFVIITCLEISIRLFIHT